MLYIESCRKSKARFFVKFSDAAALLSLEVSHQADHGPALIGFVRWCDDKFFGLNMSYKRAVVFLF